MDKTLELIIDLIGPKHGATKELAEYLGITPNVVTNWKNGSNKSYRKYLKEIADYFEVSVEYLKGNENADIKKAPASKRDEREEEFVEMFKHLNPEQQDLVIAQLKGILDTHKK